MSGLPSLFTSPIATDRGAYPVAMSLLGPKVPSPFPSNTETTLSNIGNAPKSVTTKSSLPSTFRSPIATERGLVPVAKSVFGANSTGGTALAMRGKHIEPDSKNNPTNRFIALLLPLDANDQTSEHIVNEPSQPRTSPTPGDDCASIGIRGARERPPASRRIDVDHDASYGRSHGSVRPCAPA